MKRETPILWAALLLAALLAACSGIASAPQPPIAIPSPTTAPTILPTATQPVSSGPLRLTVEGTDNSVFVPAIITVTTGQTVELNLVNNGRLPHTFTMPDLNLEVQMPPGQRNNVTFTAPAVGTYSFSSGVIEDLDTMKGLLVVVSGVRP